MQELERIHAGASTYTHTSIAHWRNFVCYMSNFNVVIFQLDPLRHFATIEGPPDLEDSESSGILALDINSQGELAIVSRRGMLEVFELPNLQEAILLVSLDFANLNSKVLQSDRRATKVYYELLHFHPKRQNIICALDEHNNVCLFYNIETKKAFTVEVPERVNAIGIFHSTEEDVDCCFLGSALSGKLLFVAGFERKLQDFFDGTGQKSNIAFTTLEVAHEKFELKLPTSVPEDEIPMTGFIYAFNISHSTALSIAEDEMAEGVTHNIATVWYGGYITVHDMLNIKTDKKSQDQCALTGHRRIQQAKCACFLADSPGILAVGLQSGIIQLVNVTAIQTTKNVEFIDYGPYFGHSADYINKSLEHAMNGDISSSNFESGEIVDQILISRGNPVLALHSFSFEGIQSRKSPFTPSSYQTGSQNTSTISDSYETQPGTYAGRAGRKIILYGSCAGGSFFIYDYSAKEMILHTQPNHSESIFGVYTHHTMPGFFSSVSADSTVKVWNDTEQGILCEQEFGEIGANTEEQQQVVNGHYGSKGGGAVNSYRLMGPLLSGAWDPRNLACYMMIGSFRGAVSVVDVWRGTILVTYPPHKEKVLDIEWTNKPACMAASVSADGVGRIYLFDKNIDLTLETQAFALHNNYMEFMQNDCSLNGLAFSPFDDLLAVACADGYIRMFQTVVFKMEAAKALEYEKEHGIEQNFMQPICIGKFYVSERPCSKVTFSPLLKNIFAATCDGGEVKVFKYEYDGSEEFRVQTVCTLTGFKSNARPVAFHPEIPYLLISGSWDGTVRIWNWITERELSCFELQSDVYGLGIWKDRPFELIVGSRDLTIRKLYLRDIAQGICHELVERALLTSVLNFPNGQMSNQELKNQFSAKALCPYACECLLSEYSKLLSNSTHRVLKESFEKNSYHKELSGALSYNSISDINKELESKKANILFVLSKIIEFFYPKNSGAAQLLNSLSFYSADDFDFYVADHTADEEFAYEEHEATLGYVLSGRSLHYFGDSLGRYYLEALSKERMEVPERFTKQKYTFYNFTRKNPNERADMRRFQFLTSTVLLAASENMSGLSQALEYGRCDDLLSYCAIFDNNVVNKIFEPNDCNSQESRLNLADSIMPLFKRYIETQIILKHGANEDLLHLMCEELCREKEFALAKLVAHCAKNTEALIQVSWECAIEWIRERKIIKAAMELLSVKEIEPATRILALGGEPFLAALFAMTVPEESSRISLYGMAEIAYMNGIEPGILLKIGRGGSVTSARVDDSFLAKWFTFDNVIRYYQYMCQYLEVFKVGTVQEIVFDPEKALEIVSIGQFFDHILQYLEPQRLFSLMAQHTGSIGQRYNAANLQLMDCVNQYVAGYIHEKQTVKSFEMVSGIESYAVELATLYNLFRHKALDPKHVVSRIGAFLSNYIGGIAATELNFFQTAAFMLSEAEKINQKCDAAQKIVDLETVKLRKLLAVEGYQGDAAKAKIQSLCQTSKLYPDFDSDEFLRIVSTAGSRSENEREREIFQAIGSSEMRCVFTPFGLGMQPTLMLCGASSGRNTGERE